ncbi:MAG: response regulator, partial [Spirochaetales bacterium]|nr:response regulator [Spirochaetales bacterium]
MKEIGGKKTILLVDDEAIVTMHETALLRKHGYAVINAENSSEALEMLKNHHVDLILLDLDLGRDSPDGTKTAERILQEWDLPIVFLTGHAEREMVDKVKGIPRYGYVLKNAGEFVL